MVYILLARAVDVQMMFTETVSTELLKNEILLSHLFL